MSRARGTIGTVQGCAAHGLRERRESGTRGAEVLMAEVQY